MHESREDVSDILRPSLPVPSIPALFDHLRVERVRWQIHWRKRQEFGFWPTAPTAPTANDDDSPSRLLVQVDLVDLGIEPVVVRAQRAQHSPDAGKALVVVQDRCGIRARRHRDRQDDVPVLLARGLAHRPADALHDVDMRVSRVHEEHRIQRGYVDSLGEAPCVREDATGSRCRALQPLDASLAVQRVVLAVDVSRRASECASPLVFG